MSLLPFVIPRHSHSHQLPKCPQPMPRPDKWPSAAGRVPARHWSETSGRGGSFPFPGLSFLIRNMGPQLLSSQRGCQGLQCRKGLWGTPPPPACGSPLHFAVSEPRAAPLPPKPATLRPNPPLNPDDTVAGPAAPLPGPCGYPRLERERVRALSPLLPATQALQPPYLGCTPLVHAVWVLTAQSFLLRQALVVCRGEKQRVISRVGPREAAPQAGAPRRPWGPSGLQTRGWVELSPQSSLQRRSVSLSLLNANLSARESVCRVLFLLQFPREIIQIPRGENVFGNKLLPPSVPLVGGGGSSVTLRGSRLPGGSPQGCPVRDPFLPLPSTSQPLWMDSSSKARGVSFPHGPSLTQNLAPS